MNTLRSTPCLAALAVVAACAAPPAPVPDAPATGAEAFAAPAEAMPVEATWWSGFDDPVLTGLIEDALARNASLKAADAAVDAVEIARRSADLSRRVSTRTTTSAEVARGVQFNSEVSGQLSSALTASWEYDAFGRLRALVESADFDIEAERQARRDLAVIIASETALAYIDLRGAQVRLDVARRNAEAQKEGLDLIQTLLDNGRATQLDFERADAQYRSTLASLPVFEAQIATAKNTIAAFVGIDATAPGAYFEPVRAATDIPALSAPIAAGNPADLLRRRPDVRQAEATLASRLALGEAARADIFPRITFNAAANAFYNDLDDFKTSKSIGFGIGPSLVWEGPDLRRVYARIDQADAFSMQAAALYEQAVLDALADAESALSDYALELERRADLVIAAAAARRALDLATLRFQEGLDDYLDVLDAQRTLLDAEDRLATSQAETASRAIRAYRALGGVWDDPALVDFRNSQTGGT